MRTLKAVKKSISFLPDLLAAARRRAERVTDGNLSRYIQGLVRNDVESSPLLPQERSQVLEELADQWVPSISDALRQLLQAKGANQAELLGRGLARLRDFLSASGDGAEDFLLVPVAKCPVFAEKQRRLGMLLSQANGEVSEKVKEEVRSLREELSQWQFER